MNLSQENDVDACVKAVNQEYCAQLAGGGSGFVGATIFVYVARGASWVISAGASLVGSIVGEVTFESMIRAWCAILTCCHD